MKVDLENVFLVIMLAAFFFIGPGILLEHRISHDYPYGYLASDAFQHQIRAEAIKDAGNFKYEASYISHGFEYVVGRYPPLLYHLVAVFSSLSGLETYDVIYFFIFLFCSIAVLAMFLVIRSFNRNVALISLPLSLLVFSKAPLVGFTWGHWPALFGQFFLIALFWGLSRIELEKSYLLIGIFLSAVVLAHTANLVFAAFFILAFFALRLANKSFKWDSVKKILYAFAIAFLLAAYYLVIFKNTWFVTQQYEFSVKPVWSDPGFYIMDFGLIAAFIFVGILPSVPLLKRENNAAALASFSMLFLGFGNYFGFDFRAFQIRFLWPVYLSFFFGFAVYTLAKFFVKNWRPAYSVAVAIVFIFLFSGIVSVPFILQYEKFSNPGLMDLQHWQALGWIAKNTPKDAKIYFFYGDIYGQDALLRNSKRTHYQVDAKDFVNSINERKIKREYLSKLPGDSGGNLVYRKSFFTFGDYAKEKGDDYFFGYRDICSFDYLVFDKASRQQVLAYYNIIIANDMLNKSSNIAFQNDEVFILKNNRVGGDCIEERNF